MNAELHKQLKDICKVFNDLEKFDTSLNNVEEHTRQYYREYEKLKKRGFSAAKGVVLIIVFSVILAGAISVGFGCFWLLVVTANTNDLSSEPSGLFMILFYLSMLLPLLILPIEIPLAIKFYRKTVCKKKNDKLQAEAQKYYDEVFLPTAKQDEEKHNKIIEDRNKYIEYYRPLLNTIPSDYLKYRAVTFFEEVVRTGRADTLKEAMNLYEEQVHRWNLEAQGERMIQQQHYDNLMMQIQLCDIEIAQSKNAATLRSIESMEFYNTFCR